MGSKRFISVADFARHGMNIHLTCRNGHCDHTGVVDPHDAWMYFRLRRFQLSLDFFLGRSALDHFRCTRCGARAGSALPTENAVTVLDFFPADERGWRMLQRRLRG